MRIKFGNEVLEVSSVRYSNNNTEEDRFIWVDTLKYTYAIDCEYERYARWLLSKMAVDGYFDATGIDYYRFVDARDKIKNEDYLSLLAWSDYCMSKTEKENVFAKLINVV